MGWGGLGDLKRPKYLKAMCEAKWEFPEGWARVIGQKPFNGEGMDIFWNGTILRSRSQHTHRNFYLSILSMWTLIQIPHSSGLFIMFIFKTGLDAKFNFSPYVVIEKI